MKNLKNKTVVITGGAGGIGFSLAEACAREGMNIVLADIETATLTNAAEKIRALGADVLTVVTDVSKSAQVEALADRAYQEFGKVHLLFNNAGVAFGSTLWETTPSDWDWVMGVNVGGVLNGIRSFVPRMKAQGEEAHIVNTASVAGLVSYHPSAPYHVSKHTVVAISEQLHHSLTLKKINIGVSVLCPGWVKTRILEADRNRPAEGEAAAQTEEERIIRQSFEKAVANGMSAEKVAELTLDAVRHGKFYILPDARWNKLIRHRMEDLLHQRNPSALDVLAEFMDDPQAMVRLGLSQMKEKLGMFVNRKKEAQ